MSVTRQRQFPELVATRTPAAARSDLQVYSISEVNGQISAIDLSPYALTSTVASISGGLDTRLDSAEATIVTLNTTTANISGDVIDLDLSLTTAIFDHISPDGTSPSVTGSMNAWGKITAISGGPFYIQLFK